MKNKSRKSAASSSAASLQEELKNVIAGRVLTRPSEKVRIVHVGSPGNPRPAPWLFDFRAVILEPKWLDAYAEIFWQKHARFYPFQVGGLETAGIPLVAAIVMKGVARGTPVNGFFIRKSRKREGLMKVIEGTLTKEKVILVDDLINTGGSFWKQIEILESIGVRVSRTFAILAFRSREAYVKAKEKGIEVSWLFSLKEFGLPLEGTTRDPKRNEFDVVWRKSAATPNFAHVVQKSTPVLDEKSIYVGTDGGTFFAIEQNAGDVMWSFDIKKHPFGKGIFSSPALHKGLVYFGAYDGEVYALDAETGAIQWKYGEADWVGSSPALAPDIGLLFIGLEFGLWKKCGGIVALDLQTGKKLWEDRTPALTHGSPLYIKEEGLVVIGSNDGVVYAYEAKTGKKKWVYQSGGDIKTRPAYDAKRHLVLVPSMDTRLHALSVKNGTPQWVFQTGAGIYSNPLVNDNIVYVASLDKTLYSVDLETGRERASFETNGRIFASPVLADNSLWIGSNDGNLYELDPETLKQRGSFQTTERIVNAIAYNSTTRRIFLPTIANELICLSRKT